MDNGEDSLSNEYKGYGCEFFRVYFEYSDGKLYRKLQGNALRPIGLEVGSVHKVTGYVRLKVSKKEFLVHRIIFLMHHGYLPKFLDHIDNDRTNNKIENLREATTSQNIMNSTRNQKSGLRGVHQQTKGSFKSILILNGKVVHRKNYKTALLAAKAYDEAAKIFHGEFAKLNFPED